MENLIGELTEVETKILMRIYREGRRGEYVMLKDVWKELGMRSKAGMPYVNKLVKKGLLVKERVGGDKRILYRVKLTELGLRLATELEKAGSLAKLTMYNTASKVPCFYCPYIDICGTIEEITPEKCEYMNKWILSLLSQHYPETT